MQALERAKRLSASLCRLVERRDRLVETAAAEFRLELLNAIDSADPEIVSLVQRGLAMDRTQPELQLALQLALDERNERNQRPPSTRRSDELPPPAQPSSEDLGDEDDLTELDSRPTPVIETEPELRYPEPGEPAVTLA